MNVFFCFCGLFFFLLPRETVTCKTLYITSKAKKRNTTRYQLYQELHRGVHTSCYFKTLTFQTEQIKNEAPREESGKGMSSNSCCFYVQGNHCLSCEQHKLSLHIALRGLRICGPLRDENMFCGVRAIFIRFI